jgi:hypothetical protein
MEGIILICLIVGTILFYRKLSNAIYVVAIIDILLRILTFIKSNLGIKEITKYIDEYVPESIPYIIKVYTDGVLTDILLWIFVAVMGLFLYYTIRIFFKKRP